MKCCSLSANAVLYAIQKIEPMKNELILNRLSELIKKGEIDNNGIVQIIELCGGYLNLKSRSVYAKENNISYNGAKRFRDNVELFGMKFIIDNE